MSLSTGLSTTNSTVATLSTSLTPLADQIDAAAAQGAAVTGTLIGAAGGDGTVQTRGHSGTPVFNVNAAGCSSVSGIDATGTGLCSTASADGATAYGSNTAATADNTTAIGFRAAATYAGSVAIGYNAQAIADPTVAVGANSMASGDNSVALGAGASATAANSVALGAGSIARESNTVSVGAPGSERSISNVAAGIDDTDAINMSQLNSVVGGLGNEMQTVGRYAYSGVASAMALAMIPGADSDKHMSIGVGGASYGGYAAFAVGATVRVTQNLGVKLGVGLTSDNKNVGVGVTYRY
jgi:autotransporter adhesin